MYVHVMEYVILSDFVGCVCVAVHMCMYISCLCVPNENVKI